MVFFPAFDQKTAQFNFASSSRLVCNWMQLIFFFFLQVMVGHLTFDEKKKLLLDLLLAEVLQDQVIMHDDPMTLQTDKSIGRSI